MSLQTRKTSGTQIKIFVYAFWELSDPPIDSKDVYTIKAQKRSKEIVKIIRDISGSTVILRSYENSFCAEKTKITTLFNNSSPRHPIVPFWRVSHT